MAADLPEGRCALHQPGIHFRSLGNWEKALEEAHEAMRLEPNDETNYVNLGVVYANLNRLDEAEAVFKQAEERKLESEGLLRTAIVGFSEGRHGADGAVGLGRHGQAGHGRLAAGLASRHGGLVREVEKRARADAAGDGFGPAQRRQRDGRNLSGSGRRCARWNRATGSRRVPMPTRQ